MKRSFLLYLALLVSCISTFAQEVDVTKLSADTKTFIFSDGTHTVKNYIYERLQAQTNCCGQDRIYLEIKIDPTGYVISAKALTGKNDCYKESVIDIVKNIKWDAADFKGPKSIYFEVKPELACEGGKENKYAKVPTFNNALLDVNGVQVAYSGSTGKSSLEAAGTPAAPATNVVTPAPVEPKPAVVTPTPTPAPATPTPAPVEPKPAVVTPAPAPVTPTPAPTPAPTTTTKPTPAPVASNVQPTPTPAPTQNPPQGTPTPAPKGGTKPAPTPAPTAGVTNAEIEKLVQAEVARRLKEQEDKKKAEVAVLKADLDKALAEEEAKKKAEAAKKAEEAKKAGNLPATEKPAVAGKDAKADPKGKKSLDWGLKEGEDALANANDKAPGKGGGKGDAKATPPAPKDPKAEAEAKAREEEAKAKAAEAEKLAKMSPAERTVFERAKRLKEQDDKIAEIEKKAAEEVAKLEQKKRDAELAKDKARAEAEKQALEAKRAQDDIVAKQMQAKQEKVNAEITKIDIEKSGVDEDKRAKEQEIQRRAEDIKKLQADIDKMLGEVKLQQEALKLIEEKKLMKQQEAALLVAQQNGGTVPTPAPSLTPAPKTGDMASNDKKDESEAVNLLLQQLELMKRTVYNQQLELEALRRGAPTSSNNNVQTGRTSQGLNPNIDWRKPEEGKTPAPAPAKGGTPAKPTTPTKAAPKSADRGGVDVPASAITVGKPMPKVEKPVAAAGSKPAMPSQPAVSTVPSSEAPFQYVSTGDKNPENSHVDTYKNTEGPQFSSPDYAEGTTGMKKYLHDKLAAAGVCGLAHVVAELNLDRNGNVTTYKVLKGVPADIDKKLAAILLGMKFKSDANAPYNQVTYVEFKADIRCEGKTAPVDVKKVENYLSK